MRNLTGKSLRPPKWLFLSALVLSLAAEAGWAGDLAQAEQLYRSTHYEDSLKQLDLKSRDAATDFLAGRDYFMLGDFHRASDFLERAVAGAPDNSEYMDWLGRVYGKRAETSNPFLAPSMAGKARAAFEKAVALNPRNSDALSDLFDYYLNAPGFLGGGFDKAETVVHKTETVDPVEAYFEQADLAQRRQNFDTAELHLRQAVAAAPHKASVLLAYAKFLAKRGRTTESDAIVARVEQEHPDLPGVWYAHAELLVRERRNLDQARTLLSRYLQASVTVDDPPKQDAIRLLKQAGGA